MTPNSAVSAPRVTGYAWAVVAMLFPVALLNYLDRMMVATMRASIRADIPSIANDADFGILLALFMWVYAVFSPVGGFLADRFSRRWMVVFSLFVWSLMTWLTGHAHTFGQMAWTRALMGLSEACYIPAALALIADFHPGPTRSRAIGLHMCGIYAGQALGGVGGYIADASSWRNAFCWFGAAGVVYAVVLIGLLRDHRPETPDHPQQAERVGLPGALRALYSGAFVILVLYFTLPAIPGWAIKNWLPTFLASEFSLKQGPAGMSATGYVTLASFVGALLGGVLADRAARRTPHGRIYISALGMGLCAPALVGLGHPASLNAAVCFMILFGVGFGFFDANNMPILCQIVRPEHRATGYGIMNMISVAAGAGVTVLMGSMRDHQVSLGTAFGISAATTFVAILLVFLLTLPRFRGCRNTN
jgi:MFS family permease